MTAMPPKYLFEEARKLYPGKKRGFDKEWLYFVKESKSRDWKKCGWTIDNVVPLLKPAIEAQLADREALSRKKEFVPSWKHWKTWIHGGWWTEDVPQTNKPKKRRCFHCGNTDVVSQTSGKPWRCWRQECIDEYGNI